MSAVCNLAFRKTAWQQERGQSPNFVCAGRGGQCVNFGFSFKASSIIYVSQVAFVACSVAEENRLL